jgi:Taurine catabolism dioxygenase TauD, TfdA family
MELAARQRSKVEAGSPALMPIEKSARAWDRSVLQRYGEAQFYGLSARALAEIDAAVEQFRLRKVTLATVEQEDIRLPSFSKDVPDLRRRLDDGLGFFVLRGLSFKDWTNDEIEMVYWGIGNYLGRVMRQNLRGERLDKVKNLGEGKVTDPYRVIETDKYFQPHTDNGMLEPRPPHYLGLMCIRNADNGGESLLVSAYTIHNIIGTERPHYLRRLYQRFAIEPPVEQRLPGREPLWRQPVFEWDGRDLVIHYIRYLMDPGMERAGTPLTAEERDMLDYIDSILRRDEVLFQYQLRPGETLFFNNLRNLHGRTAFHDKGLAGKGRELRRIWLWRRHGRPSMDPVELDRWELLAGAVGACG